MRRLVALAALFTLMAGARWLPGEAPRHAAAFLYLWIAPALALTPHLPGPPAARLLGAAGLALLGQTFQHLVWHYIPGPLSWVGPWLVTGLITGALVLRPVSRHVAPIRLDRRRCLWPLLVLSLAAAWRLGGLSYKEFQGDEGVIMVRAAAMILGDDAEIFLHQKGPVEILLPLAQWLQGGPIDEFWARLPFTWASWLGVAALAWLAWRLYGQPASVAAGLLFAVSGFSVAFGHIVQYQSLVMLWGLLAVIWAVEPEAPKTGRLLAAVFLAGALLAHYDAILFAPAAAWLAWRRDAGRRTWLVSLAAAGALLASFYVPFALSPSFAGTSQYLLGDRIGLGSGGGLFKWSGPAVWQMATFYNSTGAVVGLVVFALIGMVLGQRLHREGGTRRHAGAILLTGVPLTVYLLVVADARTHVYTFFPGLTLLASAGFAILWSRPVWPRRASHVALGLLVGTGGLYVALMFVDTTPERQRTWQENRPPRFAMTWTKPPQFGLFGFPYQAGWRAAAGLVPDGAVYASNEEEEVTNWYLGQAPRTHCADDDVFFLARDVQDAVAYDSAQVDAKTLRYRLLVNGEEKMRAYLRAPAAAVETLEVAGTRLYRSPAEVAPPTSGGDAAVHHTFAGAAGPLARLVGYDLDTTDARPGGQVVVTLYWEALAPFSRNYQTFVHLYDGVMRGQLDTAPECGINPTTRWEPGQIVPDPHIVPVAPDAPVGPIPVLVGMYDLLTLDRLTETENGADHVRLTDVTLVAP